MSLEDAKILLANEQSLCQKCRARIDHFNYRQVYYQHGVDYALPAKLTSLSSVPVIDDHSLDRTRVATTHAQVVVQNCSFPYEMDLRLCYLSAQAHKPIHPDLVGKEPGLPKEPRYRPRVSERERGWLR